MTFSLSEEVFWGIYLTVACVLLLATMLSLREHKPRPLPRCPECAALRRESDLATDALRAAPWQHVVPAVAAMCTAWPYTLWLAIQSMPPRHQCTK